MRSPRFSGRANSAFTELRFSRDVNPVSTNSCFGRHRRHIASKCAGASRRAPSSDTFVSVTLFFPLDTHNTFPGTPPLIQDVRHYISTIFSFYLNDMFICSTGLIITNNEHWAIHKIKKTRLTGTILESFGSLDLNCNLTVLYKSYRNCCNVSHSASV